MRTWRKRQDVSFLDSSIAKRRDSLGGLWRIIGNIMAIGVEAVLRRLWPASGSLVCQCG